MPIRYITERFYVIMSYIVELYTQCMSGYWYTYTYQGICLVLKSIGILCVRKQIYILLRSDIFILYIYQRMLGTNYAIYNQLCITYYIYKPVHLN